MSKKLKVSESAVGDAPECSECGAEIVAPLSVVDGFAPWLCLECSGATLADFGLEEEAEA